MLCCACRAGRIRRSTCATGIVAAFYPGASAAEVENQVTQKVEQRLFKIEGVRREKTYSTSMNGAMFINLNLEDNLQDTEKFWSKLRLDMAELKKTDLPDGVQGPVVDYDFGDTVAVLLAIHGDHYGYRELKDYAERIESAIRRIRAVSKVKRIGEQKEEIDVSSSLSRLSQYSVTPEQVMKALEGRNMVHYAGAVPTERGKPPIQTTGAFEGEEQIRRVMIDVTRTGQPVYIGDLANVDRVYKDPTQYARSRGERAILLSVEMQEGNNIVDFGKELHASLDRLRPLLPPDLKIDFVADQPTVVADRVKDFIREFGIAIASVILVTMLLLPFRVALVSAVAIPVTISATFGLLNAFGIELHQVSIAALIVVLGMVVDDAIVIADNYIELLDHGVTAKEAAWRSATELAIPVLTATLTIICSFLPFLMLSGRHRRVHSRAALDRGDRALDIFHRGHAADAHVEPVLHPQGPAQSGRRLGERNGAFAARDHAGDLQPRDCRGHEMEAGRGRSRRTRCGGGRIRAPPRSGAVLPVRRARPVRGRRLASGRLEGGSDGGRGEAHRRRAASREGGGQLHLVHRVELSAVLLQRQSAVAGQELRTVAGLDQVGGSHAEAGQSAAPATRAGGSGSPCFPQRTAARSGPGGRHRGPAYRR